MAQNKKRTRRQEYTKSKRERPTTNHEPSDHPPIFSFLDNEQHPQQGSNHFFIQAYEAGILDDPELGSRIEGRRGLNEEQGERGDGFLLSVQPDQQGGILQEGITNTLWADRHSYLHLLPLTYFQPLPPQPNSPARSTTSSNEVNSGGWSDLPSDHEDTWFFSEDEAEEFERDQKRRKLEAMRVERLAMRTSMKSDDDDDEVEDDDQVGEIRGEWDSHETPTPTILQLMKHTSQSLSSSPNPSLLEMRILTNHSKDARFAFLRGRWKETWEAIRMGKAVDELGKIVVEKETKNEVEVEREEVIGMGLLGGYGSSESESGSQYEEDRNDEELEGIEEEVKTERPRRTSSSDDHRTKKPTTDDEAISSDDRLKRGMDTSSMVVANEGNGGEEEAKKEARRLKLKAWAEKRKATLASSTLVNE